MGTKEITPFGKKLEKILAEKKMSDTDLAKKLKTQPPAVFFLKRTKKPRKPTLESLSKIFNKPMNFWMKGIVVEPKMTAKAPVKASVPAPMTKASKMAGKLSKSVKVYLVVEFDGHEQRIALK